MNKLALNNTTYLILSILLAILCLNTLENKSKILEQHRHRFANEKFSGVYLATKREARFGLSFSHGTLLNKAMLNIGVSSNESDLNSIFNRNMFYKYLHYNGANDVSQIESIHINPYSNQYYRNGIQNHTKIKITALTALRYENFIGGIAYLEDNKTGYILKSKVLNISNNQLIVEGLIDPNFNISSKIKIKSNNAVSQLSFFSQINIGHTSNYNYWQNGVWVNDDTARIMTTPYFGRHMRIGGYLDFEYSGKRRIKYIDSSNVVYLEGKGLNPYQDGRGSKVTYIPISDNSEVKETILEVDRTLYNSAWYNGISMAQKILLNSSALKKVKVDDYIYTNDGSIRKVILRDNSGITVSNEIIISNQCPKQLDEDDKEKKNKLDIILKLKQEEKYLPVCENYGYTKKSSIKKIFYPNDVAFVENKNSLLVIDINNAKIGKGEIYKFQKHEVFSALDRLKPVKLNNNTQSTFMWSTYSGLLDIYYNNLHPHKRDYIIHALGEEERDNYLKAFDKLKPLYVQTTANNFDYAEFHGWLLNTTWKFFERVLLNYEPKFSEDYALIWERENHQWKKQVDKWDNVIDNIEFPIQLPKHQSMKENDETNSCQLELTVAKINYKVTNKYSFVPILGKTPRFFVFVEGALHSLPVSLPYYKNEWQFPIFHLKGKKISLDFKKFTPVFGADIKINSIEFRKPAITQEKLKFLFYPIYMNNYSDRCK